MVYRVRHWYWLAEVARLAGCARASQLADLPRETPLRRGLQRLSALRSVERDGADPGKVYATDEGKALLSHVKETPGFEAASVVYEHSLWKTMAHGYLTPRDEAWLAAKLPAFGIVLIEPVDPNHASWLGLAREENYPSWHEIEDDLDLSVDWQRFRSLDGLMVLALLASKAHATHEYAQAAHLFQAARWVSEALAEANALEGEPLDTWKAVLLKFLSAPLWPRRPTEGELQKAEFDLKVAAGCHSSWSLPPPVQHLSVRKARRHTRAVYARAEANRYADHPGFYGYRPASPLWVWLVEQRDVVAERLERAIDIGMGNAPREELDPLPMPESLLRLRRRPPVGDIGWRVFGDTLPYDLLPVIRHSSGGE